MLKVRNLEAGYGAMRVLKGVSLHVSPGEAVAIIGANGSGKTTLLDAIAGVVRPRSGSIRFADREILGMAAERIVSLGCRLVPEGRRVFPTMTVKENLLLGAYSKWGRGARAAEIARSLRATCEIFPVLGERSGQLAGTLSGGQQQMLAIGRALMSRPRFLMMDEPSLGIAPILVSEIYKTVAELKRTGMTILLVEQNARAALRIADRGYVIETGQIVLEGTSKELSDNRDVQRAYLGKEYRRIEE